MKGFSNSGREIPCRGVSSGNVNKIEGEERDEYGIGPYRTDFEKSIRSGNGRRFGGGKNLLFPKLEAGGGENSGLGYRKAPVTLINCALRCISYSGGRFGFMVCMRDRAGYLASAVSWRN